MATKARSADRPAPQPVKPQSRAQLGKSLAALGGLANPQKQALPKGKGK